ncbi:MAG TPA: prephenate dehydratase [Fimbriimonadales bacterium]|nr:prephenate dehydratase [Fimbriimonadales bacterium]
MPKKDYRKQLEKIDEAILDLLHRRMEISGKVEGKGYDFSHSSKILQRYEEKKGIPKSELQTLYREIIATTSKMPNPVRVAYWGPPGTYTHIAATSHFGRKAKYIPLETIPDIFDFVEKQEAEYGVVPVENSTEGVVAHTLDMFLQSPARICSQVQLEIHHHLLSKEKKLSEIEKVYAVGQAEAQCRKFLRKELTHAKIVPAVNTAIAAQQAAQEKLSAAIGSKLAAKLYGLGILSSNIHDNPHNRTRFLVIGLHPVMRSGNDRCSLLFSVPHRPGALAEALNVFRKFRVNMTMIESRPAPFTSFEYVFFVDLEGHERDRKVANAIKELRKIALFVNVLGSYPLFET